MDEATEKTWPREIWMAEREAYDHGVVTAVLSEHATIARWDGDKERDREFHRYVDGDIHDTAERYYKAILEAERNAKDARIAELEAAIKRQAGAAKTLRNLTLAEVQHIKDNERKQYLAIKTLDSERDANAILTEENEALQARIAELEAENREMAMQCLASDGQAHDAYDRQKELKAKLASWQAAQHYSYIGIDGKQVRAVDLENRAIKAEAKLEMVTRGLEFIGCDDGPEGRHARATLAELKGGKDE